MGKLTACLMIVVFLISGCTFSFEVLTPAPPVAETDSPQLTPDSTKIPSIPIATFTPTLVPMAPTLAPPTTNPIFFNGRSAATPEDHLTRQSSFPAGTKIVYVIWDYQNMRQGMQIRREWYLNGQPWLTREEPWDFKKYGATGTMRDVSIHDEVNGLDSGTFHFRVYIDNVLQPIGGLFYEPIEEWVTFDIGTPAEESFMGYGSWDGQWGVEVYGGKRIILKNVVTGETRQIVIVQEVPYVTWFKDSKHFLFVDRDRSEQQFETNLGVRDHLWIVDVPSGEARRVYKGDTAFGGTSGPEPSPDGKYIASVEGSGYADACSVDSRVIFFEVASDFQSVKAIKQQDFAGVPAFDGGWVFPVESGFWESVNSYHITLDGTCNADRSKLGNFRFDLLHNTTSLIGFDVVPGDLGFGTIHGKVTDINGVPISNAVVFCEHSSYRGGKLCTGSVTTNADGTFAFTNVFFHDTDTIKVTVQAVGYETKQVSQAFFTTNDWEANVVLNRQP